MESLLEYVQLDYIASLPFGIAFVILYVIVLFRAGATYLIGRGIAAGVIKERLEGPRVNKAVRQVNKWGPIAVLLSFFTVGVQTVINLAAGMTRMPPSRYLIGLIPGAAIWASIWSTIGMSAFLAVVSAQDGNPIGLTISVALLLAIILVWYLSARASSRVTQD